MDVALVEDAQHDVDRDQGGQDEQGLVGQRGLEGLGGALEAGADRGGQAQVVLGRFDGLYGLAQGGAGGEVKGEGDGGELALVVDGQGGGGGGEVGECAQGRGGPVGRAHVDVLQRVRVLLELWRDF